MREKSAPTTTLCHNLDLGIPCLTASYSNLEMENTMQKKQNKLLRDLFFAPPNGREFQESVHRTRFKHNKSFFYLETLNSAILLLLLLLLLVMLLMFFTRQEQSSILNGCINKTKYQLKYFPIIWWTITNINIAYLTFSGPKPEKSIKVWNVFLAPFLHY